MAIHQISICLTDVDDSRIATDSKGNRWLKLTIFENTSNGVDDNLEVVQSASVKQQEFGIKQQRLGRGRTFNQRKG
jgi:hypothetical protein